MASAELPRILHLPGGMRAVDDLSQRIVLFFATGKMLGGFPRPAYASLYSQLLGLGLPTIGVEFVRHPEVRRISPPDWQCASARLGEADVEAGVHFVKFDRQSVRPFQLGKYLMLGADVVDPVGG